ncbi:F-box only protein 39-like [Physella acuta]|uniref:F-box only protein 39-like n=1 Tax=Physella acuta TaxID=109671 RepID=UPI0027DC9BF4|nr:F-box only protein 39-like [Physella acuta]
MFWGHLPDEILLLVFQFLHDSDLCKASTVCRKWRRVYHEPCLWRSRTFEFRGYCRSHPQRLEMLGIYADTMGKYLQEIRIVCPSPNLLTANNVAKCVHTLLSKLTCLKYGQEMIRSLTINNLYFNDTWSSFRSSKCLLVDSLSVFLETQRALENVDISEAYMTPPFSYRIIKSLTNSRSARRLERLNLINFYFYEMTTYTAGKQIRNLCRKCWNLSELSLNYSYLLAAKVVDVCELLFDCLQVLTVHMSAFDFSSPWLIITSDNWRLALRVIPKLKVIVELEGWPRDLTTLLVPGIPLTKLSVFGGQCCHSCMKFGEKLSLYLDHLARHFSGTLESASFVAGVSNVYSPPRKDALVNFFTKCRRLSHVHFSSALMCAELVAEVKGEITNENVSISIVQK